MDCEGGGIDGAIAANHLSFVAHEHQISGRDVCKMSAEWVDPEPVRVFRISDRNVSCQPLVITEMCKQTKGAARRSWRCLRSSSTLSNFGGMRSEARTFPSGTPLVMVCIAFSFVRIRTKIV